MRISLNGKKPDGVWVSFDELCGIADGKTKSFKVPMTADEAAAGLAVLRDHQIVEPDARLIHREKDDAGKVTIVSDEADGYSLRREGDALHLDFARPPRLGARIAVSVLGRDAGTFAFKLLPMTDALGRKLYEETPGALKKKKIDEIDPGALQEMGRTNFNELVVEWKGVEDEDGQPAKCDANYKKAFLNTVGAFPLGMFVTDRASALRDKQRAASDAERRD